MYRVVTVRSLKFSEHHTAQRDERALDTKRNRKKKKRDSQGGDAKSGTVEVERKMHRKKDAKGGLRPSYAQVIKRDPGIVSKIIQKAAVEKNKPPRGVWSPLGATYEPHGQPDLDLAKEHNMKELRKSRRKKQGQVGTPRKKLDTLVDLFQETKGTLASINLFNRNPNQSVMELIRPSSHRDTLSARSRTHGRSHSHSHSMSMSGSLTLPPLASASAAAAAAHGGATGAAGHPGHGPGAAAGVPGSEAAGTAALAEDDGAGTPRSSADDAEVLVPFEQLSTAEKIQKLGTNYNSERLAQSKKLAEMERRKNFNHVNESRESHLVRWRDAFEETKGAKDRALMQVLVARAEAREHVYSSSKLLDHVVGIASKGSEARASLLKLGKSISKSSSPESMSIWERAKVIEAKRKRKQRSLDKDKDFGRSLLRSPELEAAQAAAAAAGSADEGAGAAPAAGAEPGPESLVAASLDFSASGSLAGGSRSVRFQDDSSADAAAVGQELLRQTFASPQ